MAGSHRPLGDFDGAPPFGGAGHRGEPPPQRLSGLIVEAPMTVTFNARMSDFPSIKQVPDIVVYLRPPSEAQVASACAKGLRTALFIDANLYSSYPKLGKFDYVGLYNPRHKKLFMRQFLQDLHRRSKNITYCS